jgi:NADP-dependent 3-hydroxy acid dehydrogenase YdfG
MKTSPTIIITGASSGIGAATARLLTNKGWRTVLAARRKEKLDALADELREAGGETLVIPTDVTDTEQIRNLVETTVDTWGQIDVLFNNAGFGRFDWLQNLDPNKDVRGQFNVNTLGVILTTQAALPHMIERQHGHVINMASVAGLVATPTYSVYAASKFAIRGFSQALRREVGVHNIDVSVIYPGGVATEFSKQAGLEKRKTGISTPRFLLRTADDIAESVWRVIQRPRHIVVVPWLMRYSVWMNNLVPNLVDKIITRNFVKPELGID